MRWKESAFGAALPETKRSSGTSYKMGYLRLSPSRTSIVVRPYGLLIQLSLVETVPTKQSPDTRHPTPDTTPHTAIPLPPAPGGGPPGGPKGLSSRGGGGGDGVLLRFCCERLHPPLRAATRQRAQESPGRATCLRPLFESTQHSSSSR